jgi:hypothetical protein
MGSRLTLTHQARIVSGREVVKPSFISNDGHPVSQVWIIIELDGCLNFRQRAALMHRDVISLVTLNLILRIISATAVRVTLVLHVFRVHLYNFALHVARFGIPAHVVSN